MRDSYDSGDATYILNGVLCLTEKQAIEELVRRQGAGRRPAARYLGKLRQYGSCTNSVWGA